jgi:hypothetical protein
VTATEEKQEPQDLDVIVPDMAQTTVAGIPVTVNRLKTRELLALLKILTSGLGTGLGQVRLDFSDSDTVREQLMGLMLLAMPNAVSETVLFLLTVVQPKDPAERKALNVALDNPDPADLLNVFEAVAVQEADDMVGLGGKAQAMWSRIAPLYQKKPTPDAP